MGNKEADLEVITAMKLLSMRWKMSSIMKVAIIDFEQT